MTASRRSPSAGPTVNAGYMEAFDRLFVRGRSAVLSGTHFRDVPPVEGGRWGMSVVLVPDADTRSALAAVTTETLAVAGADHWPTGAADAVHFTVRAIEVHRAFVPPGDALVSRCASALARAAASSGPIRLRLNGLTLTPSGVMACAFPVDDTADEFADRLGQELGPDGSFEAAYHRDIWYATLVHFTSDVRDRQGLVDFVADRRHLDLGLATFATAEVLTFHYNGRQPVRHTLACTGLGAAVAHEAGTRR